MKTIAMIDEIVVYSYLQISSLLIQQMPYFLVLFLTFISLCLEKLFGTYRREKASEKSLSGHIMPRSHLKNWSYYRPYLQ